VKVYWPGPGRWPIAVKFYCAAKLDFYCEVSTLARYRNIGAYGGPIIAPRSTTGGPWGISALALFGGSIGRQSLALDRRRQSRSGAAAWRWAIGRGSAGRSAFGGAVAQDAGVGRVGRDCWRSWPTGARGRGIGARGRSGRAALGGSGGRLALGWLALVSGAGSSPCGRRDHGGVSGSGGRQSEGRCASS